MSNVAKMPKSPSSEAGSPTSTSMADMVGHLYADLSLSRKILLVATTFTSYMLFALAQVIAAAAVLAMSGHRLEVLIGVILGFVIFFPMPFFVQTAFIRPGVTPRQIAVTFSIFWAVSYAGSVVIIMIFAAIADATGGLVAGTNIPVSVAPMIFIVFAEATFLIGTFLIWRWFKKQNALAVAS